jgi:hypothetical protein
MPIRPAVSKTILCSSSLLLLLGCADAHKKKKTMSYDQAVAQLASPETWCKGAEELARLDDPRAIVPLVKAYRARHEGGKTCLIEALAKLATVERVLSLYEKGDRADLLIAMYLAPSPQYLPLIEKAAADPENDVRWQARRALSNWANSEEWRATMLRLLNEGDLDARRCAADGLRALRKRPEVRDAFVARAKVESDVKLREQLEKALHE